MGKDTDAKPWFFLTTKPRTLEWQSIYLFDSFLIPTLHPNFAYN